MLPRGSKTVDPRLLRSIQHNWQLSIWNTYYLPVNGEKRNGPVLEWYVGSGKGFWKPGDSRPWGWWECTAEREEDDLKPKCQVDLWYPSYREVEGNTDLKAEKFSSLDGEEIMEFTCSCFKFLNELYFQVKSWRRAASGIATLRKKGEWNDFGN